MNEPMKKIEQNPESYSPKDKPEVIRLAIQDIIPTSVKELHEYISSGGEPPKSNKIPGIRRLWYDDKSENFLLEGCFAAVMKAVGESPDYNCELFEALSGTLFTQVYNFEGNHGITAAFGHKLMPYIWGQIGYSYLYIDQNTIKNNYELVLAAIKTAIDKGIPVISGGIGNIQLDESMIRHHKEWCNIGGYDENDILYVNAFPQELLVDEYGYCTVKDGLIYSSGLYILNKKIHETIVPEICRKAIKSIPAFISLPSYNGISLGQKAYYDWADGLLDDKNIDNLSDDPYKGFLWQRHNAPWINALTCEYHMRLFYDRIAELSGLPEASKVKEIYMKIYEYLPMIQRIHGGSFFAAVSVISKPEARKELASVLRCMGDLHNGLFELFE
jgi:hypothetical protein